MPPNTFVPFLLRVLPLFGPPWVRMGCDFCDLDPVLAGQFPPFLGVLDHFTGAVTEFLTTGI